jgi:DedD protein
MERRVKERLIGASILVALIVLVVPELLSGPKPAARPATLPATAPEPTRNVTVDLATSKAPANPDVDAAAPSAPASASPSTAPAPATPGVATPDVATPTLQAPAPVESSAPPPISPRGAWAVQLGSFANRPNADKLARQLKGQGFSVYVVTGGSAASVRYRVRIGPLADRGSAERTVTKLKSIGHASSLVAPAG